MMIYHLHDVYHVLIYLFYLIYLIYLDIHEMLHQMMLFPLVQHHYHYQYYPYHYDYLPLLVCYLYILIGYHSFLFYLLVYWDGYYYHYCSCCCYCYLQCIRCNYYQLVKVLNHIVLIVNEHVELHWLYVIVLIYQNIGMNYDYFYYFYYFYCCYYCYYCYYCCCCYFQMMMMLMIDIVLYFQSLHYHLHC